MPLPQADTLSGKAKQDKKASSQKVMDVEKVESVGKKTTPTIEVQQILPTPVQAEKTKFTKTPVKAEIKNVIEKSEASIEKEIVPKTTAEAKIKVKKSNEELEVDLKTDICDIQVKKEVPLKHEKVSILQKHISPVPAKVAVPRKRPPLSAPALNDRPLVLATHLVPSLPIGLFEVLAEMIEIAIEKPVVLLHESRSDRQVARDVVDIAVLPANGEWESGKLLPATFVFEHQSNKNESPYIYADVVLASDRALHVEDIMDLRGHRCALPNRQKKIGPTQLLFNYLHSRGEGPAFFGNILDADSQLATLQMVAGKQAEIGILDGPVIKCHKNTLPGIESLYILTSLGPLPPYRIVVNKAMPDALVRKITTYLINSHKDEEWLDRLAPFGILRFTENSQEFYDFSYVKSAVTSGPYY